MWKVAVACVFTVISWVLVCDADCRAILLHEVLMGVLAGLSLSVAVAADRTFLSRPSNLSEVKKDIVRELYHAFLGGFLVGVIVGLSSLLSE